jgi:hypothetical protein
MQTVPDRQLVVSTVAEDTEHMRRSATAGNGTTTVMSRHS